RARDAQYPPFSAGDIDAFPRGEPDGFSAKPLRSDARCQHPAGGAEHRAPGAVEVVEMMIMAEQDGIDLPELVDGHSRALALLQRIDGRRIIRPAGIKGRVGQQLQAVPFEQCGRAADVRSDQAATTCLRISLCLHKSGQGMRTPDPNYSNNIGLDGDLMPVGHAFQDETAISSPFPLLSPVQSLLFSRTQLDGVALFDLISPARWMAESMARPNNFSAIKRKGLFVNVTVENLA